MATPEQHADAVRCYLRTLDRVAERQVVAAAEDVLCDTWIAELERFRAAVLDAAAASGSERRRPRGEGVREAQRHGNPAELALVHARLAASADVRHLDFDEARHVLAALDEELERVCLAGIERTRRSREDLARLRAAWLAAYGGSGVREGE